MANKSTKKADLKIKTLEQQVENKNKRIEHLQNLRKKPSQNRKKQQETNISDNLFLDFFSLFNIG